MPRRNNRAKVAPIFFKDISDFTLLYRPTVLPAIKFRKKAGMMVMDTPGYILYTKRMEMGLSRKQLAEGLCSPSCIAQYEQGWLIPTDTKLEVLCARLGLNLAYMRLVVEAHQKITKRLRVAVRSGDFITASKVFRELAKRERIPVVKARYERHAKSLVKMKLHPRF